MNITKTAVATEPKTGSGTADATPKSIVVPEYAPEAYKGVRVRCNSGTLLVGPHGMTAESGFPLEAGKALDIPIDNPAKVFCLSPEGATFSWVAI